MIPLNSPRKIYRKRYFDIPYYLATPFRVIKNIFKPLSFVKIEPIKGISFNTSIPKVSIKKDIVNYDIKIRLPKFNLKIEIDWIKGLKTAVMVFMFIFSFMFCLLVIKRGYALWNDIYIRELEDRLITEEINKRFKEVITPLEATVEIQKNEIEYLKGCVIKERIPVETIKVVTVKEKPKFWYKGRIND